MMQGGAYTLRIRERGDWFAACLDVNLGNDVVIAVKAKVSTSAIAKLLNRTFSGSFGGMSGDPAQMEGFFGSIWKAVKSVAKKVTKNKVFRVAKKIFRNPMFKGVAMAVPGVNVAVGALTAADMAMQAAGGVAKMISGGKGRRRVAQARGAARVIKRRAMRQAMRRRVPANTFRRAWQSGWSAVPDPRVIAAIRRYRGPQNVRQMYRQALPAYQQQYAQALPNFMQQYARAF